MWPISVNHRHQILQRLKREFIIDCVWPTCHHHLYCFITLVPFEQLKLFDILVLSGFHCWLPDSVDVELLGIAKALSDNDLTLEEREAWDLIQVESNSGLCLGGTEEANGSFFDFVVLGAHVDDAATDSLAGLDGTMKVFKILRQKLFLKNSFKKFKVVLHEHSTI